MKHLKTFENMKNIGDYVNVNSTHYNFDPEFEKFLNQNKGKIVDIINNLSGTWYLIKFDLSKLNKNLIDNVRSKYDEDTEYKYVDYGENVFEFYSSDII